MRAWPELVAIGYRRLEAAIQSTSGITRRRLDRQRGVAILMYHRVVEDDFDAQGIEPGMFVRASTFRRQMEWLARRWPVRPLGRLLESRPAEAAAAVTFDDGWRDNHTVAWPIMHELGLRPTIFLVRDWVHIGRTEQGEFLNPADVTELSKAGVEFGAHTVSHPDLVKVPVAVAESEMKRSRDAVEDWSGRPCRVFAYPFGHHNEVTANLARRLFPASVIVGGGWWRGTSDRARIPRIAIHQDMSSTIAMFSARIAVGPSGS